MISEPTIKLNPVVSSNIAAAGYDPATQTLEIQFTGGATYRYEDVPKETYEAMWGAESIGKFVKNNIAKSFKYKKVK